MKNKLVYLATAALINSGAALAQSSAILSPVQTPILDSYTAGLLECECATDHPDGHGVPEFVRKSDEMRARAWEAAAPAPEAAKSDSRTAQRESMAANHAGSVKKGSHPGSHPAGTR